MRIIFVACAFLFLVTDAFSQTGFSGAYFSQRIPDWETAIFGTRSNENLLSTGYSAELDVKFMSLENYRVEFYPTLTYNSSNSSTSNDNLTNTSFDLKQYDFSLKTNIYLLSLEADCDCPTFSRDAGILEKGFFVQIAPGLSYFQAEATGFTTDLINSVVEEEVLSEGNGLNFKLGLGVGVDIGLSDYITITPIVKYNRYFNVQWDGLSSTMATFNQLEEPTGNDKTSISQFYGGIRLGIKFKR